MLKQLKARHRNIIQMSFNGFSNNEIAAQLGLQHTTISQIIRSPLGQAYMDGLNDKMKNTTLDVRKELVSMNSGALKTLKRLMDPNTKAPAAVQLGTAKDILDRSGYKAPDKLSIDMTLQVKTDKEIDAEISALESSITKVQTEQPEQDDENVVTEENEDPSKTIGFINNSPTISASSADGPKSALKSIVGVATAAPTPPIKEEHTILADPTFDPFHNIEDV